MCFSATASFVAGSALVVLGVATLRATRRKSEIPFAAIPLLFGIQQLVEGLLWLSFRFDSPQLKTAMTYLFSMYLGLVLHCRRIEFDHLCALPVRQKPARTPVL